MDIIAKVNLIKFIHLLDFLFLFIPNLLHCVLNNNKFDLCLKTFNTNIQNCFVDWRSSQVAWNKYLMKHPWNVWVMQRHKYISLLQGQRHISKNSFLSGYSTVNYFDESWWVIFSSAVVWSYSESSRISLTQKIIVHVHIWWQMEYFHRKHFIYVIILDLKKVIWKKIHLPLLV